MDQRACKELEEPGPLQQNKTDWEEEDRGLADGGKRAGKGKEEGWGRGVEDRVMGVKALWALPAGPTWEEAAEGSILGGAGGQVYEIGCTEKRIKQSVSLYEETFTHVSSTWIRSKLEQARHECLVTDGHSGSNVTFQLWDTPKCWDHEDERAVEVQKGGAVDEKISRKLGLKLERWEEDKQEGGC